MAEQVKCPSCGKTDISVVLRTRKTSLPSIIVLTVIGLAFIVGPFVFEMPSFADSTVFRAVAIFLGGWIMWDALTGLPLPFIGIKLIQEPVVYQVKCTSCNHQWTIGEQKTDTETPPPVTPESQ